jgi:hypothetical protein
MQIYFSKRDDKYNLYINGNNSKWDLYENFRCSIIHQLRPTNGIVLTTRMEAREAENQHLIIDSKYNEFLILILEDFYDDIKAVSIEIIADYNTFSEKTKAKWKENYISVISDIHE